MGILSFSGERADSPAGGVIFTTTHWTVVLAACGNASLQASDALAQLCRTYWYPLYAYIRRRGYEAHDAQDLTQEFLSRLLQTNSLRTVDRSKGRFRSFLLGALEHFLAKEWRRGQAQKRGGQFVFVSFDDDSAERHYLREPVSDLSAEKIFEQRWAFTLLDQVLGRLRAEYVETQNSALFDELKIFLTGEKRAVSYAALAARLGKSEAALKMTVSRLRQRYGEILREEIARTVSSPREIGDELRALFAALSG